MKILVPLDGSTTAEAAVPLVLHLARGENVGLVLLMVTNVHPVPDPAPCEPDVALIREAQTYLDTARRHLASDYPTCLPRCGAVRRPPPLCVPPRSTASTASS
jgi:nucleotide-binding universal stress UspA family protein